jgi:hypothetical protein
MSAPEAESGDDRLVVTVVDHDTQQKYEFATSSKAPLSEVLDQVHRELGVEAGGDHRLIAEGTGLVVLQYALLSVGDYRETSRDRDLVWLFAAAPDRE